MSSNNYGTRGRTGNDAGIRKVAPTYGRVRIQTLNYKSARVITVDGHAERLTCHALNMDPSVQTFTPQPFTVDLIDGCLLHTPEAVGQALRKHAGRVGPCLYTPDHLVNWMERTTGTALEVKHESWQGDDDYEYKLNLAGEILDYFGYEFSRVVIPAHPQTPINRNLALLNQAMGRDCPLPDLNQIEKTLGVQEQGSWTLSSACQMLGLSIQHAPWLVRNGYIAMDIIGHHMKADSPVQLAWGDIEHLCVMRRMMQ